MIAMSSVCMALQRRITMEGPGKDGCSSMKVGCQNYAPFSGTLHKRGYFIMGAQKFDSRSHL